VLVVDTPHRPPPSWLFVLPSELSVSWIFPASPLCFYHPIRLPQLHLILGEALVSCASSFFPTSFSVFQDNLRHLWLPSRFLSDHNSPPVIAGVSVFTVSIALTFLRCPAVSICPLHFLIGMALVDIAFLPLQKALFFLKRIGHSIFPTTKPSCFSFWLFFFLRF